MGAQRKLFDGKIPAVAGQEVAFYAVCVFGPQEGRPIEIACRSPNSKSETKLVRTADDVLHYVVWVVDRSQARQIRQECHRVLDKAHKRIDSRRFDVNVEWAKKVVNFAGQERRIKLYSTEDLEKIAMTREQLAFVDSVRQTGMSMPLREIQRILGT